MANKRVRTIYYHKRLGPISRTERRVEKSRFGKWLGKGYDDAVHKVEVAAGMSAGAVALGTLGAVTAIAGHFVGAPGGVNQISTQSGSHTILPRTDSYFINPAPLNTEERIMSKKNKKNVQELFSPMGGPIGGALSKVSDAANHSSNVISARIRNARSKSSKDASTRGSMVKGGLVGAGIGAALGGPVGAAAGGGAGILHNWATSREDQDKDRQKAKEPIVNFNANENFELDHVSAAIDRIAAGANQDEARDFINKALSSKIMDGLESKKIDVAHSLFGVLNTGENE